MLTILAFFFPHQLSMISGLLGTKPSTSNCDSLPGDPISLPPNEFHIEGYIDFLGIQYKENFLKKLIGNGFHSHKILKLAGLLRANVRGLGLTLGVVTVLFDNIHKYDQYLASLHG
ncbi:hypothetical protein VP01_629g4 [Puccinia sorghi]|uniref:Uncharacterized protein n=1 Tax=Puccinia sorghi TaxID=27349 RepID=A0A0L6UGA5_9BASI|nr:hypothetical protein VP01_629g4 [Puccinia sorghi]